MMKRDGADQVETWTTRQLLAWTQEHLTKNGVEDARLSAEMLLAHALGVPRLNLFMDQDRPASELERVTFRELVKRADRHEPVDYIVGHAPFFSMMLKVNSASLIPRPSTETLVEHVVQHARRTPGFHHPRIADIGTGCGPIALALAKHVPNCRVIATDISAAAIQLAKENATAYGLCDRIEFRQGNLYAPLEVQLQASGSHVDAGPTPVGHSSERVQYLLSNPPYISDEQWQHVPPNIREYEPHIALRGGVDGLKYIRPLIDQAHSYLTSPGQLLLEIAASQKQVVLQLIDEATGLTNPHVLADHEGLPRVLVVDKSA